MTRPARPRLRRLVAAGALAAALALLPACAGERPSLGTLPPSVPEKGATTTSSTTPTSTTTPSGEGRTLTPEDLQGWIATPVGTPEVYAAADESSQRIEIPAETEAGAQTTFAVVGDASEGTSSATPGWYEVALPIRPNGATAWVPASSVKVAKTPYKVFVDLDARTLRVEDDGAGVYTAEIAIGTEDNPTPTNGTFVTELIANRDPDGAYGPYAFGLAMHSDTLTEFNGGEGQVGIHGTNKPELIGQRVSHGCVRLRNSDIEDLVEIGLPLGVPVFIT